MHLALRLSQTRTQLSIKFNSLVLVLRATVKEVLNTKLVYKLADNNSAAEVALDV